MTLQWISQFQFHSFNSSARSRLHRSKWMPSIRPTWLAHKSIALLLNLMRDTHCPWISGQIAGHDGDWIIPIASSATIHNQSIHVSEWRFIAHFDRSSSLTGKRAQGRKIISFKDGRSKEPSITVESSIVLHVSGHFRSRGVKVGGCSREVLPCLFVPLFAFHPPIWHSLDVLLSWSSFDQPYSCTKLHTSDFRARPSIRQRLIIRLCASYLTEDFEIFSACCAY